MYGLFWRKVVQKSNKYSSCYHVEGQFSKNVVLDTKHSQDSPTKHMNLNLLCTVVTATPQHNGAGCLEHGVLFLKSTLHQLWDWLGGLGVFYNPKFWSKKKRGKKMIDPNLKNHQWNYYQKQIVTTSRQTQTCWSQVWQLWNTFWWKL